MPATKTKVTSVTRSTATVQIGEIELKKFKVPADQQVYVPDPSEYTGYADPYGIVEKLALAHANNEDVLLIGDTGSGKTAAARALAAAIGQPYRRFPFHEGTDASALLGKPQLRGDHTTFQNGKLTDAVILGHYFVADEVNMAHADQRVVMNPLASNDEGVLIVEEDQGQVYPRHENFRMVATANPYEYGGTKEWGAQLMSRFDSVIKVEYLPQEVEQELLVEKEPELEDDTARRMVLAANTVRQSNEDRRITFPMSFRELFNWGRKSLVFGLAEAAEITVLNKITDPLEREGVAELLKANFDPREWEAE